MNPEPGADTDSAAIAAELAELVHHLNQLTDDIHANDALRRLLVETEARDGLLAEIDRARRELQRIIAGNPEPERLFLAMAERLGIPFDHLSARIRHHLEASCALCAAQGPCRTWLASGRAEGQHNFCRNAELFDRLRGAGS